MLYSSGDLKRQLVESSAAADKGRTEFRRDYGRLLHAPSFRRLQGKTQLFPGHESDFFRNRLTHSLEVAQVAKGIATYINATIPAFGKEPIDTDLVEFAALAHDLGHPPFGHNGEKALDDCMKGYGGFEGNAQTLRILTRVEKKRLKPYAGTENGHSCGITVSGKDLRLGLNLTMRALAAVLKYDKKIALKRKPGSKLSKGYYSSEEGLVKAIKAGVGNPPNGEPFKTIECQIMDVADDIAYSTYDLEDAMKGGFSHPLSIRSKLTTDPNLLTRVWEKVRQVVPGATEREVFRTLHKLFDLGDLDTADVSGGGDGAIFKLDHSTLVASQGHLRTSFTSSLVGRFMAGVSVTVKKQGEERFAKLSLDRNVLMEIESLKHLNYELMIMSSRLKIVEYRGYELVQTIFKTLDSNTGHLLLPEDYRLMHERLKTVNEKKRLICDFVAGMTDRYAIEFYGRLKETGPSIFKPL